MEVWNADIGPGKTNERVALTLGEHPVQNALGKRGEEQDAWCAAPADATSTLIMLPPHVSKLTTFIC